MERVVLRAAYDTTSEYRLVEVPPSLRATLQERMSETATPSSPLQTPQLYFCFGGADAVAALCTRDQTFALRKVEYSNSLVVSRAAAQPRKRERSSDSGAVDATTTVPMQASDFVFPVHEWIERHSRIFEATPTRPRVEMALQILRERYLTVGELEDGRCRHAGNESCRTTFTNLCSRTCSSPLQLAEGLRAAGAVVVHGELRLFDPSLITTVVEQLLVYLDAHHDENAALLAPRSENDDAKSTSTIAVDWAALHRYFSPDLFPPLLIDGVGALLSPSPNSNSEGSCSGASSSMRLRLLCWQRCVVWLSRGTLVPPEFDVGGVAIESSSKPALRWLDVEDFWERLRGKLPLRLLGNFLATIASSATSSAVTSGTASVLSSSSTALEAVLLLLRGHVVVQRAVADQRRIAWIDVDGANFAHTAERRIRQLFELSPGLWPSADLKAFVSPVLEPGTSFETVVGKLCKEVRATVTSPGGFSLL